ncbi:ABC-2 type transport system ATP-binding protein [Actinacidiphila yanglinensis]|uniref:ABC-type xenobiotic transporter n=1 Tax=Actinacidiphila yanglinensis TaxID=310779 RepID=A0A1H6AIX0_9ACTN|nr:ABC transporter ATP-binding protein [Actinacidiphila yanglinensis]SEG48332.1 ABC-2 type transport system ATP-binding protein [Actinacidiphila yanglinensis]
MPAVIEVRHLHKSYGATVAVDDVSFTVEQGEIFGILGPNGAGKTTTVECVVGLRDPDRGEIRVLGLDPRRDRAEVTQRLGVQLQDGQLPDRMKVGEALRLYGSFYRKPADPEVLMDVLGLAGRRGTPYAKLSGGQKQRLSIALALIGSPEVAVLDELTTGLDPQARRDTWDLIQDIRSRGVTILLVTHFMEEAERLCDRVAVIDRGRVVAVDSPTALTERVQDGQRIRFRPSVPFEDALLTGLPEVTGLTRQGDLVVVTGTGNTLHAITSVLARNDIVAEHLRVDRPSLEDAFVALTGDRAATATGAAGAAVGANQPTSRRSTPCHPPPRPGPYHRPSPADPCWDGSRSPN